MLPLKVQAGDKIVVTDIAHVLWGKELKVSCVSAFCVYCENIHQPFFFDEIDFQTEVCV